MDDSERHSISTHTSQSTPWSARDTSQRSVAIVLPSVDSLGGIAFLLPWAFSVVKKDDVGIIRASPQRSISASRKTRLCIRDTALAKHAGVNHSLGQTRPLEGKKKRTPENPGEGSED